jgi:hypothetical protein
VPKIRRTEIHLKFLTTVTVKIAAFLVRVAITKEKLPPSSRISTLKIEVAGSAQKFTRIYQKTKGLTFSRQWRLFRGLFHDVVNISK